MTEVPAPPTMNELQQGREVLVTDQAEREAVALGAIAGTVYADGDVWADLESLTAWRSAHGKN